MPHVVETAAARETGDVIDRTQFGSVSWMLDGRSFLYNRLQKMEPQSPPTDRYLKSRIYLHVLGKEPEADRAFLGIGLSPKVQMTDADAAFVQTVAGSDYVFVWVSSGQNEVALYATSSTRLRQAGHPPWECPNRVDAGRTAKYSRVLKC